MPPQNNPPAANVRKQKPVKPVFKLQSPYTAPQWPSITADLQDTLVKLLCQILSPVGERRAQIPISKGKRKRVKHPDNEKPPYPPQPAISSYLTIGLNLTTRTLESQGQPEPESLSTPDLPPTIMPPLRAVFVFATNMQLAQLPIVAALASPKVQLIPLHHPAAEKAVCAALGLPRVGALGLRADAPGADPLFACMADIPNVDVPFLKESTAGVWLGTKIEVTNRAIQELG